jgi:lactoylglutathione lyase
VFKQADYVMIMVSDMARSVAFYRDALGLALKFESPFWTEFSTGATTIALHGGAAPAGEPARDKVAGTCSIGFNVDDLDAVHGKLVARGVRFVMPPMDRPEEGIRLAIALDPDGLPVSFSQSTR